MSILRHRGPVARSQRERSFFEQLETRAMMDVTINSALPDASYVPGTTNYTVSLLGRYTDNAVTQVVRMVTNRGNLDIALRGDWAPNTVANFLAYVNAGFYDNSIFHFSNRPSFQQNYGIIQAGVARPPTENYVFPPGGLNQTGSNGPAVIPTSQMNAPITLEHPTGNAAGTVAMFWEDLTTDPNDGPNSARASFFINTSNNSSLFDAAGDFPGYATFATLLHFTRPTAVAINSLTYYAANGIFGREFGNLPLTPTSLPQSGFTLTPADYVVITSADLLENLDGVETAGWSATVTENPTLVSVAISPTGTLTVTPNAAGVRGTATIRLRATSSDAAANADDTFTFTIDNFAPAIAGLQGQRNGAVGRDMLLSALGVRDTDAGGLGGVANVEFWHDTNNDGALNEGDTLLATDETGTDGWQARVSTGGMTAGTNRVFAQVTDTDGATTSTSLTVTLAGATTGAPFNQPGYSGQPGDDVLTGLMPEGGPGAFRRIAIFLDSDNDGQFNAVNDRLLGFARFTGESWVYSVRGEDLADGSNRLFSRVTSNSGTFGAVSSTLVNVGG